MAGTPDIHIDRAGLTDREAAYVRGYDAAEEGEDLSNATNGSQHRDAFLTGAGAALSDEFGTKVVISDKSGV
jgi:hypothetical protein